MGPKEGRNLCCCVEEECFRVSKEATAAKKRTLWLSTNTRLFVSKNAEMSQVPAGTLTSTFPAIRYLLHFLQSTFFAAEIYVFDFLMMRLFECV